MKKKLTLLLGFITGLSCLSCNGNNPHNNTIPHETVKSSSQESNILIAYFSRTGYNYPDTFLTTGNTAVIAGYIQKYTQGTLFEIVPVTPYPASYTETTDIAQDEIKNNARPAIKNKLENPDQYSTVFIGYPIWYGTMPMIVRNFIETYDLSGKTIIPFCTHEGSNFGSSLSVFKSIYPAISLKEGLAVQGSTVSDARDKVEDWLKNIGIEK